MLNLNNYYEIKNGLYKVKINYLIDNCQHLIYLRVDLIFC